MLNAINELKSSDIIAEPDRTGTKTGRRSPSLCLNPDYGCFVGIELQVHKLLGVLVDNDENILARTVLDFPAGINAAAVPGKLAELIQILRTQPLRRTPPGRGIGFADPGLVDLEQQKRYGPIMCRAGWGCRSAFICRNSRSWIQCSLPRKPWPEPLPNTAHIDRSRRPAFVW